MKAAWRSARLLFRNWKLTAISVFSLAVAMALGIVCLSVSNTILVMPPRAPDANRLVMIYTGSSPSDIDLVSYPDYQYFRANNHVFTDIAAAPNSVDGITDFDFEGRAVNVMARPVSENYFAVLGIHPLIGRLFAPGDDSRKDQIAVMTYACWKRLGADPHILGKVLAKKTIVGVAPESFTAAFYGFEGDLFLPLGPDDGSHWQTRRGERRLSLIARLKPGATERQAGAELAALSGQLASSFPEEEKGRVARVQRATILPPDAAPTARWLSGILMALVVLVLVVACTNVANLLLAMAVGRRQEAAIKLALGASRGRLIREFLAGSTLLCAAGGATGYALAKAAMAWFSNFTIAFPVVGSITFALHLRIDGTVAAFAILLLAAASVASGFAPALYASSPAIAGMLGGELVVGGTGKSARRNALVILQVAVCTVVLIGVGLCQRNLYNLRHTDLGFSARNLLANPIHLESEGYNEARGKVFYTMLRQTVAAIPGVEAVTLAGELPPLGARHDPVQRPDRAGTVSVGHMVVDGDYFATLGMRVLAGRGFGAGDREGGVPVAVVNHKMAEMFWPGREAVGQVFRVNDETFTVVGVAANGKYLDLDEAPQPFFYWPLSQHYLGGVQLIARTKGDPGLWAQPLARTLRGLGLKTMIQPVTLERWMTLALLTQRVAAGCVAVLSALGLLLAVIGLFGAVSYSVSQRKKELGIRIALGAMPRNLLAMILRQTMLVAGAGVLLGVLLGVAATVIFRSQLYEISPVEWRVLVPAGGVMLLLSLLVSYLSAVPWIGSDPMEAVRHS